MNIEPFYIGYIFHEIWRKTNKKKAVEAENTTIASFTILARTLIVLLVSYVHMKTST